jgi:hypothetical protein
VRNPNRPLVWGRLRSQGSRSTQIGRIWVVTDHKRRDGTETDELATSEVIHRLRQTGYIAEPRPSKLLAMSLPRQKCKLDGRNPFTRADARAAGPTVKDLISRRYQKVFYNLYVSADVVIAPQVRVRAALRLASPAMPFLDHVIGINRLTVSSIGIANDSDLAEFVGVWPFVIANDRIQPEQAQSRQMCSSGSLPPLTGESLCCQMRRQLAAGGSGTSAEPR